MRKDPMEFSITKHYFRIGKTVLWTLSGQKIFISFIFLPHVGSNHEPPDCSQVTVKRASQLRHEGRIKRYQEEARLTG
jgi:hypothetical protein